MADTQYLDEEAGGIGLLHLQQIINLTGAAVSVALVVGVALWGYRIAVRDVAGIPVVQALEDPMRIAPVDPGGQIAGDIGLSVNAIAAEGTAPPPAEQLVLAPRPMDLAADDLPFAASDATPALDPVADPPTLPEAVDGLITPLDPVDTPTQTTMATLADLPPSDLSSSDLSASDLAASDLPADPASDPAAEAAMADGIDVNPLSGPDDLTDPAELVPMLEEPEPEGTLVRSLRPLRRPTEMVVLASMTSEVSSPVEAQAVEAPQVAAAAIASGTRMVQLGAFDNEADAMTEWTRLVAQFGDLISGKSRVIQDAQSGGRNFVRLRAMGFADESDARRFCSALLSENAVCVPVAQR